MATHFLRLTPDQQALVRQVRPALGVDRPKTKRYMMRSLAWSAGKFYKVQRELIDEGWPLKPTKETTKVHGHHRPLYRILTTVDEYEESAQKERVYNVSRIRTGQKIQRQGQRDNRTAASVFNEEQRLKNASNILRGERTPVPIGDSGHDPVLKKDANGDHALTKDELAREMAVLLKQHPKFR